MNSSGSYRGAGLLLVLSTAVISGISTFVNTYAVVNVDSASFVTARNIIVALLVVPLAYFGVRSAGKFVLRRIDALRLFAIGIIGGGIPFLLFFYGLQVAASSGGGITASFVYRTLFVMATVLGVVALKERFNLRVALGAGLLLVGNLLLLSLTTPIFNDGVLYVFIATAMWAVEYTISKRTLQDLPSGVVALGRMGFGALFLSGYVIATSQAAAIVSFGGTQWMWVGISAALLTAFVATWYTGLARVELGTATSVLVLGFPITWLLAISISHSAWTVWEALGVTVIVSGATVAIGVVLLKDTLAYLVDLLGTVTRA